MSSTRQPPHGRITILFTDIEDSSRMNTALGDSVYRETMRDPHCQRLRVAIEAHDGFEVKTVGDSFMVAFDRALANAETMLFRLLDASLVRRSEVAGPSRYELNRFTRSYALEKLDDLPASSAVRQRFVKHFRELVVANDDINDLAKLAVLDAEWQNAIAAAEVAERSRDWGPVDWISAYLSTGARGVAGARNDRRRGRETAGPAAHRRMGGRIRLIHAAAD